MGFQILIKAKDNSHADPEKDRHGCYKKGYPVVVMPLTHAWGRKEGPPNFVVLRCEDPAVTPDQVQNWIEHWKDDLDYEVVSQDAVRGRYTVRIFEKNISASGSNKITINEKDPKMLRLVAGMLNWGCADIAVNDNDIRFDIDLWEAAKSDGFWDTQLIGTKANFTLASYNPATGVAQVQAEFLDDELFGRINFNDSEAEKIEGNIILEEKFEVRAKKRIEEKGGTLVSFKYPNAVFEIERSTVLQKFRAELKQAAEQVYCRRRFYFTPAQVDYALAEGGTVTLTRAQILAAVRDKLAE